MTPCPDCGVTPGCPHAPGCDVAVCQRTGIQRLICESIADAGMDVPDGRGGTVSIPASHPGLKCGDDTWTGEWPGKAECREYGWWAVFADHGWERCAADAPGAVEDLNRLRSDARWNPDTGRWVAA